MSDYIAPIADMKFNLATLGHLSKVAKLPRCEEVSEDLLDAVLNEAATFANEVLAPLNWSGDQEGCVFSNHEVKTPKGFKEAYQQAVEAGWFSLSGSTDFGGQGLPAIVAVAVSEMWHSANMAFALCPMLTAGAIEAIEHHGNEHQQKTFLPRLVSGEWAGTMNLTEPNAGSDLSVVATKAKPDGDHYLIYGTKIFITYGEHDFTENIIHLVLARLPDAPEGVKGISLFIVPKFLVNADGSCDKRNDVKCISIEHKLGIHASPTAVMQFGDTTGAVGYLVGKPHHGLQYMFTMMNNARLAVGLEGVGIAERATQKALRYAGERVQGKIAGKEGKLPIAHHADVQRMLMTMRSQTQAMRALAYLAAKETDLATRHPDENIRAEHQHRVDLLTPMVKGWSTEQSIEIASLGVQIHGGMGYVEETGAAQHLRDARITTIYEGTTGIQANDLLGRKIIRDGAKEANKLLGEIVKTAEKLSADGDKRLADIGKTLNHCAEELRQSVDWVVKHHSEKPAAVNAGAYSMLKSFGATCGGWLLGESALAALHALKENSGNAFYNEKIGVATFYALHVLAPCATLARSIRQGEDIANAMHDGLTDVLAS